MHVKRLIAMILLFLGGAGSLLYGSLYHVVAVDQEKQREITIAVPTMPGPGEMPFEPQGFAPPGPEGFMPDGPPMESPPLPPSPPGVRMETVFEQYVEVQEEPEWTIVWEVTIGGVTRLANGQLKRTYSGKPPALCPS